LGALLLIFIFSAQVRGAEYVIDPAHSFVEFRIKHLGFSWLHGNFKEINGTFRYDTKHPSDKSFKVIISTKSVDTHHAERDKHLRSKDFLDVQKYPEATFISTRFSGDTLEGMLTLHGVTKPITIKVNKIGEGKDPWGGYRAGFSGKTVLKKSDFGITYDLGPVGDTIEFDLGIEGIRK
jgi:polyisoprenoid-binding protein YceI